MKLTASSRQFLKSQNRMSVFLGKGETNEQDVKLHP
jgi:hypothetical protein